MSVVRFDSAQLQSNFANFSSHAIVVPLLVSVLWQRNCLPLVALIRVIQGISL